MVAMRVIIQEVKLNSNIIAFTVYQLAPPLQSVSRTTPSRPNSEVKRRYHSVSTPESWQRTECDRRHAKRNSAVDDNAISHYRQDHSVHSTHALRGSSSLHWPLQRQLFQIAAIRRVQRHADVTHHFKFLTVLSARAPECPNVKN